jgi:hypothetical protein
MAKKAVEVGELNSKKAYVALKIEDVENIFKNSL